MTPSGDRSPVQAYGNLSAVLSSAKDIQDQISQHASTNPDAIAVVYGNEQVSYFQLNQQADELASILRQEGVGINVVVAVQMSPSIDLVVCLLAILKAGGCYLPIDSNTPALRAQFVIDDSMPIMLISDDPSREVQHPNTLHINEILQTKYRLVPLQAANSPPGCSAGFSSRTLKQLNQSENGNVSPSEHAAYIIYTSGTTGKPKGCIATHANVIGLLESAQNYFQFDSNDVWTLYHSFAFDFSVWEIWGALSFGGRLVIVSEAVRRDPQAMVALLERERITVLNQTPSAFGGLLQEKPFVEANNLALRYVIFGGEALNAQMLKAWFAHYGDQSPKLVNMYGITETTVHVTFHQVSTVDLVSKNDSLAVTSSLDSVPTGGGSMIGRPLPGVEIYLLDSNQQLVEDGEIGEIVVGGWGVTCGYLNRKDLTSARFITKSDDGGRLYRSGDLGRRLPNGDLIYLGRIDQQVKLRGYRIEPAEIEAQLLTHPCLAQAVVVRRNDDPANPRLVAYWVPLQPHPEQIHSAHTPLDAQQLRSFLAERLPDYMVPSAFVQLDALPLTSNGKLDRNALPAPSFAGDLDQRVQPHSPVQIVLHTIWAEVLGHSDFGITDNFFAIGGHSLATARLMSRIEQAFGTAPPLSVLFQNSSIETLEPLLLTSIDDRLNNNCCNSIPAAVPIDGPFPAGAQAFHASFAQTRIWFLHQLEPNLTAYHLPALWRLQGELNIEALQHAFSALIERHPTLRTAFHMVEGEVLQLIHPPASFQLHCDSADLQHQQEIVDAWLEQERTTPFDLTSGILIRARLLILSNDQHLLLLNHHHIASDGWSTSVLARDLVSHYNAALSNSRPRLPVLNVHYQDYSAWQRQNLSGQRLQALHDYWIKQLDGLPPLDLPTDHPRPARPSYNGAALNFSIEPDQLARFEDLCRTEGATLQMGLLALLALLFHRYSRQDDFAIGIPIWGRNHQDLEDLVGFFINTLPIRTRFQPDLSFRTLLQQVKRASINAYDHQELPFEQMVKALQLQRDSGRIPIAQVMLQLMELPENSLQALEKLHVESLPFNSGAARFDLEFYLHMTQSGGLSGSVVYATDLFDAGRIERLIAHLITLLGSVVEAPDASICALNLLPQQEQLLIESWQEGPTIEVPDLCVHQLFELQVERTPEAIAMIFEGQQLTYSQLNARANLFANHLIELSVGPEVIVAVCLERSIELIVALLGIIKAGGAYLPIDPGLPTARRAVLLEQAGCCLLLDDPRQVYSPRGKGPQMDSSPPASANSGMQVGPIRPPDPGRQLVYISFTSGSTGIPKGVAVEHRSVNRLVINNEVLQFTTDERVLQLAPPSFDAATLEIWGALLNGGTLVLYPPQQPSSRELAAFVVEQQISTMWLTAGLFHLMVDEHPEALWQVRQLLAGGDRLSVDHVKRLLSGLPDGHVLINGYGPTENTTFTSCHSMYNRSVINASVPIGKPISNTTVYVLNESLQPSPVGLVGELYIGGDGLARGYLHQPALTAERFIHDVALGRLYRSGDLVSWSPDGELLFHGRNDNQIKLRGYRIELDEIESALQSLPAVTQALVLCQSDGPDDKYLVGYVVLNECEAVTAGTTDGASLRQKLSTILPSYMVPSWIMVIETFPINPNGKVNRRALPKANQTGSIHRSSYRSSLNSKQCNPVDDHFRLDPLASMVLEIWNEVLGHTVCRADDNFFDLGGHSLAAAHVVARLEKRLPTKLTPADLFRYPTPRLLTERLRHSEDKDPSNPLVTLRDGTDGPPLFLIHGMFGDVFGFVDFARCMPPGRKIYGVQIPRAQVENQAASVESLANLYCNWIRQAQPDGPYHLMAGSAGGWFAYAVADALQRQGLMIRRLILLDTLANPILGKTERLRMLVAYGRQRLMSGSPDSVADSSPIDDLRFILGPRWRRQGLLERFGPLARHWLLDHTTDYSLKLVRRYSPPRLTLDLDLLTPLPAQHWRLSFWPSVVTGDIRIHNLFFRHADFFAREHAPALATTVQSLLSETKPLNV